MLFFFVVTPPSARYPLSLHDALPISPSRANLSCGSNTGPAPRENYPFIAKTASASTARKTPSPFARDSSGIRSRMIGKPGTSRRSEEHTSELQSRGHLVCRLLLEKKK